MSRSNDPIGSRREARETALEILYAAEARETDILEAVSYTHLTLPTKA